MQSETSTPSTSLNAIQAPVWNNSNIYKDFKDPKILKDLQSANEKIEFIKKHVDIFETRLVDIDKPGNEIPQSTLERAQELTRIKLDVSISLRTLSTFGSLASSVDSKSAEALSLQNKASQLITNLNKSTKPLDLFLLRCSEDDLDLFLKDPRVQELSFVLKTSRLQNDFLLSPAEETLLEGHSLPGLDAWGKLYTNLSGTIKVDVKGESMGLARASNLLFQNDASLRQSAYRSINRAWTQNEVSTSAILNSIYGWRLENYATRSKKRPLHYLDQTCFSERITRQQLETLMTTTYNHRSIGQRALRAMAAEFNIKQLGPWDILAPYPSKTVSRPIPFAEAMTLILEAFSSFSSDMADFAQHAWNRGWIDGAPTENRNTGAYCAGFASARESRLFMTYEGTMKDVMTLAHELGHAYHSWVMRDLSISETHYTSSLAETASIFAETLVRQALLKKVNSDEEKKRILWQELEAASAFIINIPARFEFEKNLFEKRQINPLTPDELRAITSDAWKRWYEDTLSEYNDMFWASKLHFSITSISFYNYPYLFGYLFSLGIYAVKDEKGDLFKKIYVDLLRDTGRKTPAEIVKQYLQKDLSSPEFWQGSLKLVEQSVSQYESLITK